MPEQPFHASRATQEFQRVVTVLRPAAPDELGLTDAHNHVWIVPPEGSAAGAPSLKISRARCRNWPSSARPVEGRWWIASQAAAGEMGACWLPLPARAACGSSAAQAFTCASITRLKSHCGGISAQAAADLFAAELMGGMQELSAGRG